MTYIVSSGALNSAQTNQPTIDGLLHGAQQRGEQMRAVPHCQHT